MTDDRIVRMLRVSESDPVQQEAADEIERLRAVVQAAFDMQISNHPKWEALARAAMKETNRV